MDRVPEELQAEVRDIVQEAMIKISPRKTNARRQNGYLRGLTNSFEKKSERQRRNRPI